MVLKYDPKNKCQSKKRKSKGKAKSKKKKIQDNIAHILRRSNCHWRILPTSFESFVLRVRFEYSKEKHLFFFILIFY